MPCMKTGADVYLSQYGRYVHCDAHIVDEVLLLRVVPGYIEKPRKCHFTVYEIDYWFDQDTGRTGTIVSSSYRADLD